MEDSIPKIKKKGVRAWLKEDSNCPANSKS
jgi:hypothetical protein